MEVSKQIGVFDAIHQDLCAAGALAIDKEAHATVGIVLPTAAGLRIARLVAAVSPLTLPARAMKS